MTDISTIINTPIINPETDIFWQNEPISSSTSDIKNLIITNKFEAGSPEEIQLNKILEACKLSKETCVFIQLDMTDKKAWHTLKNNYHPQAVILFGVHPQQLGIAALFRFNQYNNYDGTKWIPTLSLNELEQNAQAKKDLWVNALKPTFVDNN